MLHKVRGWLRFKVTQCIAVTKRKWSRLVYTQDSQALLAYLQEWIRTSGIPPYNKVKKKGELKFVLLTRSQARGEFSCHQREHSADPHGSLGRGARDLSH